MWSKSVRADPRNLDRWCPMDELISRESGRVRWTDGEMTEFLRVWKRDSVMANCYDRHLMTDGVRWTDWKIFPRQVPESLD